MRSEKCRELKAVRVMREDGGERNAEARRAGRGVGRFDGFFHGSAAESTFGEVLKSVSCLAIWIVPADTDSPQGSQDQGISALVLLGIQRRFIPEFDRPSLHRSIATSHICTFGRFYFK